MAEPTLLLFGTPLLLTSGGAVNFVAERRFQLLAYLALEGGWVERDRIGALFWPELEQDAARRNVRKVVHRARQSGWLQGLEARGERLRWPVATDLAQFRLCTKQARPLDAHQLYRGPLMSGLDDAGSPAFTAWLGARRTHLHVEWRDAALAALPQVEPPAARAELAQRLCDDDPLDERSLLAALAALRQAGRPAQADALYHGYVRRLAEELGIEPSARAREAAHASTAPAEGGRGDPDPFVGRRLELQELRALLGRPGCRLVTVCGPGGIGKSRLVRQAMAQLAPPGQSYWVALEDLGDETAALTRLAAALGARLHDRADVVEQIAAQCGGRDAVVVFDNAEHMSGLAGVLRRLLDAWPGLRALATSRMHLGLADERLLPLDGLSVPDADSRDAEAAVHFDAVRLFELRAVWARPGFELLSHLDAVIEIVERVGGLPLAIELAAAWVRLLPPQEIARDLRHALTTLQRPAQAAAPRHASVRVVFEQSWRLLAPSERRALARLSVFRGGFQHDAAGSVAQASLPVLASLVDKSLLAADAVGRFGMHPLVAQFAAEQLASEPGAAERGADAHAAYWAQRLQALAPEIDRERRRVLDTVGADQANCEAAWRHAVAAAQPELLLAMLPALHSLYSTSGRHREGCRLLRLALAEPSPARPAQTLRAHLLTALAALHYLCGDLHDSEALSRTALALARELGQRDLTLRSQVHLGICLNLRGHARQAQALLDEALDSARTFGGRNRLANVLFNVAHNERLLGRFARAAALNEEALALWRETGNADGIACGQVAAGNLMRIDGRLAPSRALLAQTLAFCREQGLAARERQVRMTLGHTLVFLGEYDAAREHIEACRHASEQAGQLPMSVLAGLRLTRLELMAGRLDAARAHCRRSFANAHAHALDGFAAEALCLYAQVCAAAGDDTRAQRLWRLLQDCELLDRSERDLAAQRLGAPAGAADGTALDLDAAAALLDDPAA